MQNSQPSTMNYALESMRGLCALFVVLLHDSAGNFLSDNTFINNSHVAVDFFFVLSGYVISLNYGHRIHDWLSLKAFLVRRLMRIYPLHFLVLMIFVGIEGLRYFAEVRYGLVANTPALTVSNPENFVLNLLLLQGVLGDPRAFNPPSWSISVEYLAYACFALAVLTRRTGPVIFLAMMASMFYMLWFHNGLLEEVTTYQLIRCIWSFSIGYFVFRLQSLSRHFGSFSQIAIFVASALSVIYISERNYEIFLPLLFGVMVLSLLNHDLVITRALKFPVLTYIGAISYSIYMVHSVVYWLTSQFFRFVVPRFGFESWNQTDSILFTVISMALTIVAAHFTYHHVEMRFYRRHRARARQIENGTAASAVMR